MPDIVLTVYSSWPVVSRLRPGENVTRLFLADLDKLMIRTQLKKPIEEYKSISPHVAIARKMRENGMPISIGMIIEYYIAEGTEKRSLVRERARMPEEMIKGKGSNASVNQYDLDYYLNNQILPAVENILEVFKINVRELFDGKKQMNLSEF